jgi:hypothetical protein
MANQQQIRGIYVELVKRPYFFVAHSELSAGHERYDRYVPPTLREFMLQLFGVLADDGTGFMKALAEIDDREFMKSPQHRRYVARNRDVLYIKNPHLEKNAVEFRGYWIGTNVSHSQVASVARMACEAAKVTHASIRKLPSLASIA